MLAQMEKREEVEASLTGLRKSKENLQLEKTAHIYAFISISHIHNYIFFEQIGPNILHFWD